MAAENLFKFTNSFLREPDSIERFAASTGDFWLRTVDPVNGGLHNTVDHTGKPMNLNARKGVVPTSRTIYGLSKAYALTGNEAYLDLAEDTLDFLYAYFWDTNNRGWHAYTNADGSFHHDPRNFRREIFDQHYALVGIASTYEVTREPLHKAWLWQGLDYNVVNFWDFRPAYEGFYVRTNRQGGERAKKDFQATMDGLTTHLLPAYLASQNPQVRALIEKNFHNLVEYFVPTMEHPSVQLGMVAFFDDDWDMLFGHNENPGKMLKTSWNLSRAYLMRADPVYRLAAERLLCEVLDSPKLYDATHGGPYATYHPFEDALLSTDKSYWMLGMVMTAGLSHYFLDGDPAWLAMVDESMNMFFEANWDQTHGGVWDRVSAEGDVLSTSLKANDTWKGGFHSMEVAYYLYLYTQLMVHQQPATLHYRIAATETARVERLAPVVMPEGWLNIASVRWESAVYENFDATALTLNVPAGVGGHFAVTFELRPPELAWEKPVGQLEGWLTDRWMDWVYYDANRAPWIYSYQLGWLYVPSSERQNLFAFDVAQGTWLWTNDSFYPWIARVQENGAWLWERLPDVD